MTDKEYNKIQNQYYEKSHKSHFFWQGSNNCRTCIYNTPDNTINGCRVLKGKCPEGLDGYGCKFKKETTDYFINAGGYTMKRKKVNR